jgi:hypothetical protein
MDDGSWTGHGVTLATNNFTKAEVELLALEVLENNFNLGCPRREMQYSYKY